MDRRRLIGLYQHVVNNSHWWPGAWDMDMEKQAWRGIAYYMAGVLDASEQTNAIATLCKQYEGEQK